MWLWTDLKTTKRDVEPRRLSPVRCGNRGTERMRSGKNSGPRGRDYLPFFRWRVYGAREASQGSALRSDRYAAERMRP